MRIALVHDYLAQDGGAERVLKAMHEIWPEAPIFVLFHDEKKITGFDKDKIKQSFLHRFPFVKNNYPWYLPLMPRATEKHDLRKYDVVLSSTSSFAKGVITAPDTLHVCYCHTPPRFLWAETHDYIHDSKYSYFVKLMLPRIIYKLRMWDKMSADRVDHFIANSKTIQKRIGKYYRRGSDVIHPPVDTNKFDISKEMGDYFVAGGRLVPYKRFDLIIQTFNRLRWPIKIFGTGPELSQLKKYARSNIEFLGNISEEEKRNLLGKAKAFINPQLEDFGITPVEAMATGRPVIAYGKGGTTETVIENETGVFFNEQTWESLLHALLKFKENDWDSEIIKNHADNFNTEKFKIKIKDFIDKNLADSKEDSYQTNLIK